jgi:GntR family transcriptional regulator
LNPGQTLPSIRKLAKDLRISVITTKRAYEELEKEGYIDTVSGKGCFVSDHNKEILMEQRMKLVEEKIASAVEEAKISGIPLSDMKEMLELLYKEED